MDDYQPLSDSYQYLSQLINLTVLSIINSRNSQYKKVGSFKSPTTSSDSSTLTENNLSAASHCSWIKTTNGPYIDTLSVNHWLASLLHKKKHHLDLPPAHDVIPLWRHRIPPSTSTCNHCFPLLVLNLSLFLIWDHSTFKQTLQQ